METRAMAFNIRSVMLACTAVTAMGYLALPEPAQAQFGIPGGIGIRIPHGGPRIIIGPGGNGGSSRSGTSSRRSRGSSNDDDSPSTSSEPSRADRDRALASIAPATKDQTTVFKSITASGVVGTVGAKDQKQ